MVKSNTVTIEVVSIITPPEILSVKLKPDRTSISPGESVTFFVYGEFESAPTPEQADNYQLECKIYINDSLHDTLYFRFEEGSSAFSFNFTLTFPSEGTYDIYVDVNVVPIG